MGRVANFREGLKIDRQVMKGGTLNGYSTICLGNKTVYIHKLVATLFLKRPRLEHKYVIHLNYDREDNNIANLKWVTIKELSQHKEFIPGIIALRTILQINRETGVKRTNNTRSDRLQFEQRATRIKQIAATVGRLIASSNSYMTSGNR